MSETAILKRVMLEASKLGLRVWRNHVGGFYAKDGSFQRTGLCKGTSDLIGIMPDGRFLAIEVKRPGGKPSPEQINFIDFIRLRGGVAFFIDDEKKLKSLLDEHNKR